MPLPPVSPNLTPAGGAGAGAASGGRAKGFGDALQRTLDSLNTTLKTADDKAESVAKGEGDVQEAVLGMVQAELDLRVALAVRDRVVEAYRELERMAL